MRTIIARLLTPGRLHSAHSARHLRDANSRLSGYGIRPSPVDLSSMRQYRAAELLEAAGSATIGSLESSALTPERRFASLWAIVRYVADLEAHRGRIRLSGDGMRYKEVARGNLSGDLGLAWSALVTPQYLSPACTYLDIDHAGSRFVRDAPPIAGLKRRSRPDFVAVRPNSTAIDLVEAKGRKAAPGGGMLSRAALQLFAVEGTGPHRVRRRFVTTIHGSQGLTVAAYRVRRLPGRRFDPAGDVPHAPYDEEQTGRDPGLHEEQRVSRPARAPFPDALHWYAGRFRGGEEGAVRWETMGEPFEGVECVTVIGASRVTVRQGVAAASLRVAKEAGRHAVVSVETFGRSLTSRAMLRADEDIPPHEVVTQTARGGVMVSPERVTAIDPYGTVLEVLSRGG